MINSVFHSLSKYNAGNWVGNENCSDPQKFFESVVFKLEDLVISLEYEYFNESVNGYSENWSNFTNQLWSKTDSQIHGRCFTTVPTIDHIQLGIQEIHLVVSSEIYLYFHTPGMFLTTKPNTEILQVHYAKMVSESSKTYEFEVEHDLFNMLSHQGELCLFDSKYSKDKCANEEVEKELYKI